MPTNVRFRHQDSIVNYRSDSDQSNEECIISIIIIIANYNMKNKFITEL